MAIHEYRFTDPIAFSTNDVEALTPESFPKILDQNLEGNGLIREFIPPYSSDITPPNHPGSTYRLDVFKDETDGETIAEITVQQTQNNTSSKHRLSKSGPMFLGISEVIPGGPILMKSLVVYTEEKASLVIPQKETI